MMKKTSSFLFLAAVLALLSGCGGKSSTGTGGATGNVPATGNDKHLIVVVNPDYESFDPAIAYEPYGSMIIHACYDNLVEFDGSLENLVPAVAESYGVSDDGLTYTFKLRSGIRFASGNPLTAADVRWSIERGINIKGNASFMAAGITGIDAPDDATVIFHVKERDPSFPIELAFNFFAILDSKTATAQGATNAPDAATTDTAKTWLDTHAVGSGPYQIESYTPKVAVVLVRNPHYWGKAPYYDKITVSTVTDSNTQLMMLRAGDVDIAFNLGAEQIKGLAGVSGITILDAQSLTSSFLLMNRDPAIGGPVANPKVQKAIRLALDYPGIQTIAGPGMHTPAAPFPLGLLGSLPPVNVSGYPKVAEAKALLAEAGVGSGFSTKLYVPTNTVVGVELLTLAQKLQHDLAAIGITAELVPENITISLETYRTGRQPLGLWYWSPDYPDNNSQLAFLPGNTVGLRANWTVAGNPTLAALGTQAASETDQATRIGLFNQIQQTMIEDTPFAMLLQHTSQYAVRTGLTGATYLELYQLDLKRIAE
ncbi:MAG: ABC transporter substrate-binding protein [Treponema sp.]|jgi:peptide/nickel transport system substrate-binding protein|nr:ABC transporter substrate-binding protein [Treponema sp.]